MSKQEAINIIKNEMECVRRGNSCDRNCGNCDLVKPEEDILDAYETAIRSMEILSIYETINFDEDEIYE